MDWIKKHYERALLGAFALVLIACSGLLSWQALSFPGNFSERNSKKNPDNTIAAPSISSVDAAASLASDPRSWSPHEGSLFVSRPYVLKDDKIFDPIEGGGEPLHPPITNAWLVKYNLDYGNPNVANEDPDKDGFTNLEEFLAGTDPTNEKSVPPYYTKLRLTKFDPVPFRLKFDGDSGDGELFAINTKDAKSPTQFVKLGDMIAGTPYKLIACQKSAEIADSSTGLVSETIFNTNANYTELLARYKKEYAEAMEKYDKAYDLAFKTYKIDHAKEYDDAAKNRGKDMKSLEKKFKEQFQANNKLDCRFGYPEEKTGSLTIQNTDTGQKIVLVYDKEANDPTSYGEFLYLWNNSKLRVKKDDEFTLAPENNRKYKLIDISAQEAQIEDIGSGQKFRIGKAE